MPGQRIAVFVDVDRLIAETGDLDGEIAYTKLEKTLGGKRTVIRTVAYGTPDVRDELEGPIRRAGFDVRTAPNDAALAVAIAVDAMAIGPRVDCVVMTPGSSLLAAVADALRSAGIRVETAGFGDGHDHADLRVEGHSRLGTECMFTP